MNEPVVWHPDFVGVARWTNGMVLGNNIGLLQNINDRDMDRMRTHSRNIWYQVNNLYKLTGKGP